MHTFTQPTREWLATQGWRDSRQVETEGYVEALNADGYDVPDAVKDFLRSFGGLTLEFMHHRVRTETDKLRVDPVRASAGADPLWVEDYSRRAGATLCPVGLVAIMSPDGRVFGGFDHVLVRARNCRRRPRRASGLSGIERRTSRTA